MEVSRLDISSYSDPSYTIYMAARRGMFISWVRGEARPMQARVVDRAETQTHTFSFTRISLGEWGRHIRVHEDRRSADVRDQYSNSTAQNQSKSQNQTSRHWHDPRAPHLPPYPATCTGVVNCQLVSPSLAHAPFNDQNPS